MISIHVSAKRRLGTLRVVHRTSCLLSWSIFSLNSSKRRKLPRLIHRSTNLYRNKTVAHSHSNTGSEIKIYSRQQRIVFWTREGRGYYIELDPEYDPWINQLKDIDAGHSHRLIYSVFSNVRKILLRSFRNSERFRFRSSVRIRCTDDCNKFTCFARMTADDISRNVSLPSLGGRINGSC